MIVVVSSECAGGARQKSLRIIDEFLPRIGRRTWSGRITLEGLARLRDTLAKSATKSTSICCQRVIGARALAVEWFIGNRRKFDRQGKCAVSETERLDPVERASSDFENMCRAATELAALFHDLGKFTAWFQEKLRGKYGSGAVADPIRHEMVSYAVMKASFEAFSSEDEWLAALSDPAKAPAVLEAAYRKAFSEPDKILLGRPSSRRLSSLVSALEKPSKTRIHFVPRKEAYRFSLVSSLVITHHRLPAGMVDKWGHGLTLGNMGSSRFPSQGCKLSLEEALSQVFSLPEDLEPLWQNGPWLEQVSQVASRLREVSGCNFEADLKACAIFGRTSLILGDHRSSQVGNTRFPKEGILPSKALAYANTSRIHRGALAETLASHLVRTKKESDRALDVAFVHRNEFPALTQQEIPEAISSPRAPKDSPFRWQSEAGRATRKAYEILPLGSGFFGVLMAGTGSGKTRAAPTIMAACRARRQELRLNVCTGMRSLTLQGGLEYRKDMGFAPDDVAVVVGDKLTSELFAVAGKDSVEVLGTDAEEFADHIVVQADMEVSTRVLPAPAMKLIGEEAASSAVSMLSAPVMVSTIDILMPAASAVRGNHVLKSLRLGSAELILDEIDGYGNEDIVAIARLVYLAAAFGRKVLISSATVTPEIAKSLYRAYKEGWRVHQHASGQSLPVMVGWYSEVCSPRCIVLEAVSDFEKEHSSFVETVIEAIKALPARRKAKLLKFGSVVDPAGLFSRIDDEMDALHDVHCVFDDKTGKRISVGVVRWNNVAPSMIHARHLLNDREERARDVFVIPYNGTLLPAMRHRLEEVINPLLSRRLRDGKDPILANRHVREILDVRSKNADVMIVMVATSVEEVGRDHDFDWAIAEPGSLRAIIQLVGRVMRHRHLCITVPNVAIMERCFRDLRNEWEGKNGPVFAYPGIETPLPEPKESSSYDEKFHLAGHEADYVYDLVEFQEGIDARSVISAKMPSSRVGEKERLLLAAYLEVGLGKDLKLSVPEYLDDPIALLSAYHPRNRRFRRSHGFEVSYCLRAQGDGQGWIQIDDTDTNRWVNRNDRILPVGVDEGRLLLPPVNEIDFSRELATKLSGDASAGSWKQNALLTIQRPLRDYAAANGTDFHYHSSLGFAESKPWVRCLL